MRPVLRTTSTLRAESSSCAKENRLRPIGDVIVNVRPDGQTCGQSNRRTLSVAELGELRKAWSN